MREQCSGETRRRLTRSRFDPRKVLAKGIFTHVRVRTDCVVRNKIGIDPNFAGKKCNKTSCESKDSLTHKRPCDKKIVFRVNRPKESGTATRRPPFTASLPAPTLRSFDWWNTGSSTSHLDKSFESRVTRLGKSFNWASFSALAVALA
jgi:hypothetical protein